MQKILEDSARSRGKKWRERGVCGGRGEGAPRTREGINSAFILESDPFLNPDRKGHEF